jgi:DNA-binding response OmpR family regulator
MGSSIDKPTLLIIDDERNFSESLQLALEDEFTVCIAGSLGSARHELSVALPEVVLLDVHLPDGNGTELLCELRQASHAPIVIVMTAYAATETCVRALDEGADAFVTKPLDIDALKKQIAEYRKQEVIRLRSVEPLRVRRKVLKNHRSCAR